MASDTAYNKSDVEKIIQMINDGDVNILSSQDFDQFQYQGFDPFKVAHSLNKVRIAKNIPDDVFKKDVVLMVGVGMIKGSVNEHNINKMSDAGKIDLKNIIAKYGVKMGGGKGQSADIITFPRMMATFPDVAIRLVSVIGAKEFRGGPMNSTRLPDYMQVQVFPAIIPKDTDSDVKRMLLTASLCYSIDQTVQISQIQNPDLIMLSSNQSNFTNIGNKSPVPSDEVRKAVFKKLTIVDDYARIVSVLEDFKAKIDKTFVIMTPAQFQSKMM